MGGIPLEEVVRLPLPGGGGPHSWRFVGDSHLVWLQATPGSMVQELRGLALPDGAPTTWVGPSRGTDEASLSLEEKLRRERLRERALGVTSFRTGGGGRTLMVPMGGAIWVDRVEGGVATGAGLRELVPAPALDPQLSPDGRRVAFVRDGELCVAEVRTGEVREVTSGARGTGRTHGLAEFVAQEEMHRGAGFWWSPDGARIAFAEVDDTHVPIWRIPYEGKPTPSWEDHRYPFAGAANARVRLFVVPSTGGDPVLMDLGGPGGAAGVDPRVEYLARVHWMPDGSLLAQVQDRKQQRLELRRLDPATGRGQTVLVERSDTFVELDDLFRPLDQSPGSFLWGSSRSGFLHLHVVGPDGVARALTEGEWVVDDVVAVDEGRGRVFFTASKDSPLERHLYSVALSGGAIERHTVEPGWHTVVMDGRRQAFVDTHSSRSTPPRSVLRRLDGTVARLLHETTDPRCRDLVPPEPVRLTTRTGETLHGLFYRPDGDGPHPTVVFVYGGPHVQRVFDAWDPTVDLRAQHLRSEGYAVVKIDNRGSARRGVAFASSLYGETGRVEIEDQADGVRQLIERGWVHPQRVGITGWSYGGYATLMALLREPELFRVGVAGAPVTHWDGYDTHYTERYMGLPDENALGYERSSALHVDSLRGALMIVHGMLDENVHFRHTGRLVNALVHARKEFELQLFPDERHLPRKPADRLYMEQKIVRFLLDHLR
jgi:dipeptidyl-peptidase-4